MAVTSSCVIFLHTDNKRGQIVQFPVQIEDKHSLLQELYTGTQNKKIKIKKIFLIYLLEVLGMEGVVPHDDIKAALK